MKKIILLFAMICASVLNGMEQPKTKELEIYKSLSEIPELQKEIIDTALATSNNLDEAINMIEKLSILRGVQYNKLFNNITDFTKLIHILANRFNTSTKDIAKKFEKSTTKEYKSLAGEYNALFKVFRIRLNIYANGRSDKETIFKGINELLADGLDVNYIYSFRPDFDEEMERISLFQLVFDKFKNAANKGKQDIAETLAEIIELLHENGAKPSDEFIEMLKQAEQSEEEIK